MKVFALGLQVREPSHLVGEHLLREGFVWFVLVWFLSGPASGCGEVESHGGEGMESSLRKPMIN